MASKVKKSAGDGDVYVIEVDGRELYLPRVTGVIDTVMGQGKSGMAYWGGQLAIQHMCAMLNEAQLVDDPDEYFDEDEWYADWKAGRNNPIAVRDAAGDRGRRAHSLLEGLLKGETVIIDDNTVRGPDGIQYVPTSYERGVLQFYKDYFSNEDPNLVVLPEQRVFSIVHGYAGTADGILMDGNGTAVLDLKTHKAPARFSDMLQTSAYGLAWEEMHPGTIVDMHMIILADEDGNYSIAQGYVNPTAFLALLELYHAIQKWEVQ